MYKDFFWLKHLPFKITPDLTFFYKNASRKDIANAVINSLSSGEGIIKVVGEVGSGKTTLLRLISQKIPKNIIKIFVISPNLSPIGFLKAICFELNISLEQNVQKLEVIKLLRIYLIEKYKAGQGVVLLVDESQSMTIDTLEEIRLLGNLETQKEKLLQIVLFGQPELDVTLNDNKLKPLKNRIASSFIVPPLDDKEVMSYLNSRMKIAGYLGDDLFSLKVSKQIRKITSGLPRNINLLADKLLMAAFSDDSYKIKTKHFKIIGEAIAWYERKNILVVFGLFFIIVVAFFMLAYKMPMVSSVEKVAEVARPIAKNKKETVLITPALINQAEKKEVLKQLSNWAEYWSKRKDRKFFALYSENYATEKGYSRIDWQASKQLSLQKNSAINLELTEISITQLEQGLIETRFLQNYKSNLISFDSVYKKIVWKKEKSGWKIIQENTN